MTSIYRLLSTAAMLCALFLVACQAASQPKATVPEQTPITDALQPLNSSKTLLFDSSRTGNFEIFLHQPAKKLTQLSQDKQFDSWWPRLSPNGQKILFYRAPAGVHDRDYSKVSLWLMDVNGSNLKQLRAAKTNGWAQQGHAEWSPNGEQLVMFGGSRLSPQIFITDANGQNPRQITKRAGVNLDPAWSPDAKRIVFVACPAAICFESSYEIYILTLENSKLQRLSNNNLRDHDPYFSPDGKQIAWLTQTSTRGVAGEWNIQLSDVDGKNQRWLTNDKQINSKPAWSKDGKHIYFHRLELKPNARFQIWQIDADSTNMQEISPLQPGNNEYPTE